MATACNLFPLFPNQRGEPWKFARPQNQQSTNVKMSIALSFFLGPEFTKESTVEDEESDSGSDGERRRVRRERKVRSGTWMVGTGENLRVLGRQTCLVMRTLDRHAG